MWRERIALMAVIAFLLAGMGYVSHVDKPHIAGSNAADNICAFCLHFERIGGTPETTVQVANSLPDAAPVLPPQAAPPESPALAYFARGPPA